MSARRPTGFVRPTVGPPPPPPRLGPGSGSSTFNAGGAASSSATGGSSSAANPAAARAARKSRTEAAIFDAFSDPRGVTTVALSGEISSRAPTLRPSLRASAGSAGHHGSADRARSASPPQAATEVKRSSRVGGISDGPQPVVYALAVPKGVKGPSNTLRSALAHLTATSSSAAYMDSRRQSMAGLSRKARKAGTLRRRADDARIQQLRGIFAGHDANRDGFLSEEDLVAALLGLGIEPTGPVLAAFASAAKTAAAARSRAERIARLSQAEGMDAEAAAEVVAMQDRAAAAAAAAAAGRSSMHGAIVSLSLEATAGPSSSSSSSSSSGGARPGKGSDSFIEVDLATFVRVIMTDLPELSVSTPGALESTAPHTEDLMLAYDAGLSSTGAGAAAGSEAASAGRDGSRGSSSDATSSVSGAAAAAAAAAALGEEISREPSGTVPLSALLHVLCEVEGPAALGVEEVTDLLTMTGILSELQARSPDTLYATQVDYGALLRLIQFPLPQPKRTAAAAASASASTAGTGTTAASEADVPPPPPPPPSAAMRRGGAGAGAGAPSAAAAAEAGTGTGAGSGTSSGGRAPASPSTGSKIAASRGHVHSQSQEAQSYAFMGSSTGRDATSPVKDVRGAPAMPAAAARPSALKGGRLTSGTGASFAAASPLGPAAGTDRSPAHGGPAYGRASAAAAAASAGAGRSRFSDRLDAEAEASGAGESGSARGLQRSAAAGLRVRF